MQAQVQESIYHPQDPSLASRIEALKIVLQEKRNIELSLELMAKQEWSERLGSAEELQQAHSAPLIIAIPLQNVNIDNGALFFLPRSHTLPHPDFNRDSLSPDESVVSMEAGDITIFISTIWHRGGGNCTLNNRDIVFFEFSSKSSIKTKVNVKNYQSVTAKYL